MLIYKVKYRISMSWASEFEGEESSVIWLNSSSNLEKVNEALSLSGEAVNDVLIVVGGWSLEEEAQVGKDWTHSFVVDRHSCEKFTQNDHVDHQWSCKERVFTDVVRRDGVDSVHEDA